MHVHVAYNMICSPSDSFFMGMFSFVNCIDNIFFASQALWHSSSSQKNVVNLDLQRFVFLEFEAHMCSG